VSTELEGSSRVEEVGMTRTRRRTITGALALVALVITLVGTGCGGDDESSTTTDTTATEATTETSSAAVTLTSPSFDTLEFEITECTNEGETDLVLSAERDGGFVLEVDAPDGTGTVSYTGGSEEDGVDASGTVTSVTVGDAGDFTVEGTWDDSSDEVTLEGSCAGAPAG
jgi:hypothetical protein